jgi:flavodoxin I
MKSIMIIYGSTTGNTENMAAIMGKALQGEGFAAQTRDVVGLSPKELLGGHDMVLLGCPAYGDDEIELQEDFAEFFEKIDGVDLKGRKFAVFAPGDRSYTYFCGSVDLIEDRIKELGGELLNDGLKVEGDPDDALDEINDWCRQLVKSL